MPQYYFTISRATDDDERCVVLQDVAAALDYACSIARELSVNKYGDPGLTEASETRSARWCSRYRFWPPAPEPSSS